MFGVRCIVLIDQSLTFQVLDIDPLVEYGTISTPAYEVLSHEATSLLAGPFIEQSIHFKEVLISINC